MVIDPTLNGIAVLGGIVLIRTFLSFPLDVEYHWPRQRSLFIRQYAADAARERSAPAAGGN